MEVSNSLVSWLITHLGDLQPTYIGVIIHLLSTGWTSQYKPIYVRWEDRQLDQHALPSKVFFSESMKQKISRSVTYVKQLPPTWCCSYVLRPSGKYLATSRGQIPHGPRSYDAHGHAHSSHGPLQEVIEFLCPNFDSTWLQISTSWGCWSHLGQEYAGVAGFVFFLFCAIQTECPHGRMAMSNRISCWTISIGNAAREHAGCLYQLKVSTGSG